MIVILSNQMVKYIEKYILYECIGTGVYGQVFRATHQDHKTEYAVKIIPLHKFKENKKLEECTVNEVNILSNIEVNPHVIRYYDMLKTSNNYYFVYQYCNEGTLKNRLAKNGRMPEAEALFIFRQIIEAFKILNKYNIMHRDMKPDNIFFHNGIVKLGDFGFCKSLSEKQMTNTMLGSPIYMAPEVLKGEIYSNKADIWSIGVVLYEMIYGLCPYQSNSIAKLIEVQSSKEIQFPTDVSISPVLKTLIMKMLTKDSNKRISWLELFKVQISNAGEIELRATSKVAFQDSLSIEQSRDNLSKASIDQSSRTVSREKSIKLTKHTNPTSDFKSEKALNADYFRRNKLEYSIEDSLKGSNQIREQPVKKQLNERGKDKFEFAEKHKTAMEGICISLQVIESKMSNCMGYSYLVLGKAAEILKELVAKCTQTIMIKLFQAQIKEIEIQQQEISLKMFKYELTGLDNWKSYLQRKFFEDQQTILVWYKIVTFLNGSYNLRRPIPQNPAEIVKEILF